MPPADPTHYDILDVAPTATPAEIRKAYVELARVHHPDYHLGGEPVARAADEREMQRINEAWTVLRDPGRRQAYDAALARPAERSEDGRRRPRPADYAFTPYDDDDTDHAELLDDTPIDGTKVSRSLQVLPAAAVAGGLVVLGLGALLGSSVVLAVGLVALAAGVLAFVATPVVAIMRSYQADKEP